MRDNDNNKGLKASQASARSDEESLVKRAQQGCHLACTELLERHRPLAYRTVYRITRNQDDTEDVLQDASLRAFLKIKHFDGRSRFSTWFVRIAINSALMLLRKRKRWNLILFEKPLEPVNCGRLNWRPSPTVPKRRYCKPNANISCGKQSRDCLNHYVALLRFYRPNIVHCRRLRAAQESLYPQPSRACEEPDCFCARS